MRDNHERHEVGYSDQEIAIARKTIGANALAGIGYGGDYRVALRTAQVAAKIAAREARAASRIDALTPEQSELTANQAEALDKLDKLWSAAKRAGLIAGDYMSVRGIEEDVQEYTDDPDRQLSLAEAAQVIDRLEAFHSTYGFIDSDHVRAAVAEAGLE